MFRRVLRHRLVYMWNTSITYKQYNINYQNTCGPGRVVGIATGYTGWTVRGSNPGGGEFFRTCPDRPWGPPSLLYSGYRVFSGGKE